MTDQTFTKADLDAAIADAKEAQDAKNRELLAEVKALKADLRKHKEISPDDLAALETERDDLRAKLTAAEKAAKDATKAAETAAKALETEQGAARSYALDAEISAAIASGGIVPALVPAFTAMVKQQAKADLVDGKYAVQIGDKAARDYIASYLESDDGKAFKAAAANNGGGAPGGKGNADAKTITRSELNGMDQMQQAQIGLAAAKGEVKIIDRAA